MPERPTRRRLVRLLAVGAVALATAACSAGSPGVVVVRGGTDTSVPGKGPVPAQGTTLDRPLPDALLHLTLTDADGTRFTLGSLHGKTVVLADFLTLCQEICPLTSVDLRQVDQAVAKAGLTDQVEILEVTVDPQRDTPARLAAYRKLFGARPGWRFATASPADLDRLWKFLGVATAKVGEDVTPAPTDWWTGKPLTYDVQHQDLVYVLGPEGHERWEDDGTPDTRGAAPPPTLDHYLSPAGRKNLTAPADPSWTAEDVQTALTYVTGKHLG
jgi:protein SCO1/2